MELVTDFRNFLSSIQPDENAVADAKAAHEKVREQLRTDSESKDAHTDTFLSGSYARYTAINDINDVDVICLMDIDKSITTPEVVLAWVQTILDRYYTETRQQGRSVGANAAKGVWLDIVPAIPMSSSDGPLWIPDRQAKIWVQTHPKGQIAAGLAKNKATNGFFVQIVKLMKAWRDRLPNESCQLKSYVLEALIHETIGQPTTHAAGIVNVLEGIERNYGYYRDSNLVPSITDPGNTSVNVAKRWSSSDFNNFMTQVKSASVIARNAFKSADEAASRRLWRQLFGSQFGA